ncbi:50S ribosomal protein L4/L1e [Alicyclobacillus hesperidum URH17-3-68]|uniref:Large ribosomal subunit protein uL4 n=1 Tax=Alicyclobacillus hesperidum TaxID=89784 RepID=A0A1H2VK81_9BACL|nr:50S ribosomal protein L4 [Alicyclobacillus hesperidum]EJY56856.1 50S ribosomal protein L4/L1e [Alicyclobacillus hesperidum URH17-3-68]GLV12924.1 50S ribosomal protein L4 [Alicyclobacillus hesperidum]SDW68354.1 large subunit ribosomal protein L4 [Alicyclobacillus hesperidum]
MPTVAVLNTAGQQVSELQLSDKIFGAPVRLDLMHQVVLQYLAARRAGTHKVKNRAAVSGGGRKPWRQKGTGRARQGSIRAPQWKGGGVVFGPTPRSYAFSVPKKVRRLALYSALSSKVAEGKIIVLDDLQLNQPKTKEMVSVLKNLNVGKALIVDGEKKEPLYRSSRNIPGVKYMDAAGINVYELLRHDHLVLTKDAVAKVEEVFA